MIKLKPVTCSLILVFSFLDLFSGLKSQTVADNSAIDKMLFRGDFMKVIDTCNTILAYDSLDPAVYYKLSLAYQNSLDDGKAYECLTKAASLDPENKTYNLALARTYYSRGKYKLAEPLFVKLYDSDTLNWPYANYLTNIYIQSSKYDSALNICHRFLSLDSNNYLLLDRTAYTYLKKKEFDKAVELYNRSLSINSNNLPTLKNLAYIYATTAQADTAIQILSRGISIDSTDMDLYISRAQINYSKNYTKRALDDYLILLASGDSSRLYLKRAGIGYCYNLQPDKGIEYLLLAYRSDSSDYETTSFLAQSYYVKHDFKSSIRFYTRTLEILYPVKAQLAKAYILCAQSQNDGKDYKEAISSYQKAFTLSPDPNINIFIANIYDEKLNNSQRAVDYYQRYLNSLKDLKGQLPASYIKKVEDRVNYLKNKMNKPNLAQ